MNKWEKYSKRHSSIMKLFLRIVDPIDAWSYQSSPAGNEFFELSQRMITSSVPNIGFIAGQWKTTIDCCRLISSYIMWIMIVIKLNWLQIRFLWFHLLLNWLYLCGHMVIALFAKKINRRLNETKIEWNEQKDREREKGRENLRSQFRSRYIQLGVISDGQPENRL